MFNPGMFDPAIMSFFKQAGNAFTECAQAEAAGKLDKALDKYCHGARPLAPNEPYFAERCQLYAAKAFALAHIDGQVSWGGVKTMLAESPAWPPSSEVNANGYLFLAYMLGFLYGSELPADRHKTIEGFLPMASKIAASPNKFAQQMGIDPSKLQDMAAKGGAGLGNMMNMFKK